MCVDGPQVRSNDAHRPASQTLQVTDLAPTSDPKGEQFTPTVDPEAVSNLFDARMDRMPADRQPIRDLLLTQALQQSRWRLRHPAGKRTRGVLADARVT